MKILYLCCDSGIPVLGYKGASIHVRELISAFRRAGHDVILAAQVLNKNPWETPASLDAKVIQIRASPTTTTSVAAVKEFQDTVGMKKGALGSEIRRILFNREVISSELKRQCDQSPPDFIYERLSLYGIAGVLLARLWRVPLLLEMNAPLAMEHNTYREELHAMAAASERWTLSQADAVLPVSSQLRKHVLSLGIAPDRVHTLPNGVDPTIFCPAVSDTAGRARLGLSAGPVIGFVGGLRPWHGVEVLPEVLQKLAQRHSRVQMVVVGDGPLRAVLEKDFEARGVRDRVQITGIVSHDQVPAIIRHFDIALAPYPRLDHGFYFSPLKLYEYMACGIPVVASAVGQISEVIKDGKTGLLCPPQDLSALTAACDRLLRDRSLRHRLGQSACKLVHTHYTWDHNSRRITNLANSLRQAKAGTMELAAKAKDGGPLPQKVTSASRRAQPRRGQ